MVRQGQDLGLSNLATKADLADARAEIIKWVMGTIGFQTLVIVGAVVALARIGLR